MLIVEPTSYDLGPYRVDIRPRPDSPAWPVYIVWRGALVVGRSFSRPDLDCCRWLDSQRVREGYAEPSEQTKRPYGYTAQTRRRQAKLALEVLVVVES